MTDHHIGSTVNDEVAHFLLVFHHLQVPGTGINIQLFSPLTTLDTCPTGATVGVGRGVVTEFSGVHQVFADNPGDLIADASCP